MNGIIVVLKPPGMSSHDVVYIARKALNIKKIGHTGTLDQEAAGVLPLCIGKATKAVDYLTDKKKKYRAVVRLGLETETYDIYGKIISERCDFSINQSQIEDALTCFTGELEQMPPIFSSIKVDGKKLYHYALNDEEVIIKPRKITIYDINFIKMIDSREFVIDIECSKGTYIRSLCHDIGVKLGLGASMGRLIRTYTSPFAIEDAISIEELKEYAALGSIGEHLISIEKIFDEYNKIRVKHTAYLAFVNGNGVFEQGLVQRDCMKDMEIGEKLLAYCEDKFMGIANIGYEEETERKYVKLLNNFSD